MDWFLYDRDLRQERVKSGIYILLLIYLIVEMTT